MPSYNKGSYTDYDNKIGLFSKSSNNFISNERDVVLNFPYKDCILEGGMTKEDAKRDERFLNKRLDAKDIDTLLEPKVLTNFKYISKDGEQPLTKDDDIQFFDNDGELKHNLLIKGNNLIALHTLYERLAGKVKLIYIDPPYYFTDDKPSDTFSYNSNFKLSSWLVFMNNRLRVARELLNDDGIILISIDEDGMPHLKVLIDEIFGESNYISTFIWRRSGTGGLRGIFPVTTHEYILSVAKNKSLIQVPWYAPYSEMSLNDFRYEDNYGRYKTQALYLTSLKQTEGQSYQIELPNNQTVIPPLGIGAWRYTKEKFSSELLKGNILFKKTNNSPLVTLSGEQAEYNIYTKQYLTKEGTNPPTILPDSLVGQTRTSKAELKNLGLETVFSYAKPESLLWYLIEMITNPNDIVLDYHLGSGTTAAVAHKMGRRWIGVEQMDYIETIAKERLKKVISGEQGGISKTVNWQGGGDFIYMELKKYNQDYIERILSATNMTELEEVKNDMLQNAFIKFWYDKKTFDRETDYRDMSLEARQVELINILDENQLYLNYLDMNDNKYEVNANERELTNRFYGNDSESSTAGEVKNNGN